ncbi:hypothetical protein SAMN05421743_102202 [Thalassobacillus cyri]|uniref:Uncharacterized protein n=1 Tax=Thalassobacillus cyri TaxID=571932 RepID=A0A1H3XMW7_9BACI|nr:hypothetical protein [Thalassobacillus cyri]SEA00703.1 hypothetical protein SAMN05421743_102202 [Thalassobacillus cyri]
MNMVVFDGQPVTHINLLKNRIDTIETGGITNLSGGMFQECQNVLQQQIDNYVNRVLRLSDGVANAGITDIDQLNILPKTIKQQAPSQRLWESVSTLMKSCWKRSLTQVREIFVLLIKSKKLLIFLPKNEMVCYLSFPRT